MKIKILRGEFRNTVHEARMIHKGLFQQPEYQVTEGQLQGMIIDYMDCIVVDEGKTYTEAQYSELAKKVTKLEEERTYLLKEINALKADKQLLLETIADDESNHKVELPIEVAEAIEGLRRNSLNNYGILARTFDESECRKELIVLRDYLNDFDNLLKALVNGYIIKDEQTTELEEKVSDILNYWLHRDFEGSEKDDCDKFAKELIEFFKENLQAM